MGSRCSSFCLGLPSRRSACTTRVSRPPDPRRDARTRAASRASCVVAVRVLAVELVLEERDLLLVALHRARLPDDEHGVDARPMRVIAVGHRRTRRWGDRLVVDPARTEFGSDLAGQRGRRRPRGTEPPRRPVCSGPERPPISARTPSRRTGWAAIPSWDRPPPACAVRVEPAGCRSDLTVNPRPGIDTCGMAEIAVTRPRRRGGRPSRSRRTPPAPGRT